MSLAGLSCRRERATRLWVLFVALVGLLLLLAAPAQAAGPTFTSPPQISSSNPTAGVVNTGDVLTETPAVWTGPLLTDTIQWFDCDSSGANCVAIAGTANGTPGSSYTVTSADLGYTIVVEESATDSSGGPTVASSSPTAVVTYANTTPPVISGTAQYGQTLTADTGSWNPAPTTPSYSYQWSDCDSSGANCTPITGATNSTYTPTGPDIGMTIEVQVTLTDTTNGGTGTATSAPTVVVAPFPPSNTAAPAIFGIASPGSTLNATNGNWSNNPSYSYQWSDCDSSGANCTAIAGAASQTYTVAPADVGSALVVVVTATYAGGSGSAPSAPTGVAVLNPTSVSLVALPGSPVTGQMVSMVASVSSTSSFSPPVGTVTVANGGTVIDGCASLPVTPSSMIVDVTCQTALSAADSPASLTAVFTPSSGSGLAGSASPPLTLTVGRAQTTTALDVSNPTVKTGASATYTATVSPPAPGPFTPSGSVSFTDNGVPIATCATEPLVTGLGLGVARCTVRYARSSHHVVSAIYQGDAAFLASTSSPVPVSVHPLPVAILGAITAKMHWEFFFTPSYTRVLALVIHRVLTGTTVTVLCHGRGCPLSRQSAQVRSKCAPASAPRCHRRQLQTVDLSAPLRRHRLRTGTRLTVKLSRARWVGKEYDFSIRAARAPLIRILCVAPGARRAGVGC